MSPRLFRCPASSASRLRGESGFALLITVTLLAFLVLLLVSLASLTRVETMVAGNSQQLTMARQNALTALNIAIGSLQKYAGPDQRSTARADILSSSNQDGARQWTGVWGNANNPQSDLSSTPALLQWLVSGNEGTAFNPPSDVSTNAASFGQISSPPTSWDFSPEKAITGLTLDATVDSTIRIDGTGETKGAALLVGPHSAGDVSGAQAGFVVAPLVDIKVAASSVPGGGSSTGDVTIGRYAYWVGDEGVKARLNEVDPYVAPTPQMAAAGETADAGSLFRLMSPQRAGIERVSGYGTFPVNDEALRRVLGQGQACLVDTGITHAAQQARFHDLTTVSAGVLADSLRGGLKRDLTFAFARNLTDYREALGLAAGTPNPLIPVSVMPAAEQGPTWEELRSYGTIDGSAPIIPRPQTGTEQGIYPILVQARLTFGGTAIPGSAGNQQFILHIYPTFVLANPYDAPLAASTYQVRMDIAAGSYFSAYIGKANTPFWRRTLRELFEGQVFSLDCPQLAPGEARIFTLASSPGDEQWGAVKTYPMDNDWDAGAAKIALNTVSDGGAEVPDNALYKNGTGVGGGADPTNGLGVHLIFGDNSNATPNPVWGGDGGSYTGYRIASAGSGPQSGGTLSFSLTDTSGNIYQRVENLGYAAWPVSQYGMRGSDATSVVIGPVNPQGTLIFRLADSGGFKTGAVYPYYSQFNWRAPLVSRPAFIYSKINSLVSFNLGYTQGGSAGSYWIRPSGDDPYTSVEWSGVGKTTSLPQARLNWQPFDVPRTATGLVSLGQLQHFNAGGYNDGLAYPAPASDLGAARPSANTQWRPRYVGNPYPIGNSRAHPNVDRDEAKRINSGEPYYDFSYLLNRSLFDGFFFSTYPQSGSVDLATKRLANSRLKPFRRTIASDSTADFRGGASFAPDNVYLAARNLMIDGAFNVNSTSVEAWQALLSAFHGTQFNGETGLEGPFLRSIHQPGGSAGADDGVSLNAWNGFRNLTPAQIHALATQIVAQIQKRGVSLGLSDFINRRLTSSDNGLAGPIQAAIDTTDETASGINANFPTSLSDSGGSTVSPLTPTTSSMYNFPDHLAKHGLEGIAGWLSQADIVQALAPVLTARSDTFRIRTYGETVNPATGAVTGRAWCEAIVQRMPDYVSGEDDAVTAPASLSNDDNKWFGRRFIVVSFRWLAPSDI